MDSQLLDFLSIWYWEIETECIYFSGAAVSSATRPAFNKDRCFNLLVLDDQNTDWSKYFRGKRLHGDYDIRVEQAEFTELGLTANAEAGTSVTLSSFRSGSKVCLTQSLLHIKLFVDIKNKYFSGV